MSNFGASISLHAFALVLYINHVVRMLYFRIEAYINQLESPQIPEPQAVHEPPSIPRASLAYVGEGNFVLDAEPEDLKWSPRTISVAAW